MSLPDLSTPRKAFEALIAEGMIRLHFVPQRAEVEVPGFLKDLPVVSFDYGLSMPVPILDLAVEDGGVRATLSIDRRQEPTFVPWAAVAAIQVPLDDHDLYVRFVFPEAASEASEVASGPPPRASHLRSV